MHRSFVGLAVAAAIVAATAPSLAQQSLYVESIEKFRAQREKRLQSDYGWLSVVGLHWLGETPSRIGSAADADLVLREGAPARVGEAWVADGEVRLRVADGAGATRLDEPLTGELVWEPNAAGQFYVGPLQFTLLARGAEPNVRRGIRVKDPQSDARRTFAGLDYFPIDPAWRIPARLERYPEPRSIVIDTVIDTPAEMLSLGSVEFAIDGTAYSMEGLVYAEDDAELFVMFKDATSGDTTYGAGRYVYARLLAGDRVDLDFNRAYSPPCAFTPFATCPLPPRRNRLPVAVTAGERAPASAENGASASH